MLWQGLEEQSVQAVEPDVIGELFSAPRESCCHTEENRRGAHTGRADGGRPDCAKGGSSRWNLRWTSTFILTHMGTARTNPPWMRSALPASAAGNMIGLWSLTSRACLTTFPMTS